jgi:hypothetical protein
MYTIKNVIILELLCVWLLRMTFRDKPLWPPLSRSVDTPPNKRLRYLSHWSISSGTIYYLNDAGWNTRGDHGTLWCEPRVATSRPFSNISFPCSRKEGHGNHAELAELSCSPSVTIFMENRFSKIVIWRLLTSSITGQSPVLHMQSSIVAKYKYKNKTNRIKYTEF